MPQLYVSAMVVHQGMLLFLYHLKNRAWLQPGGKAEEGEPVLACLYRELLQETGIEDFAIYSNPLKVMVLQTYDATTYDLITWSTLVKQLEVLLPGRKWPQNAPLAVVINKNLIDVFYAVSVFTETVSLAPHEHSGAKWVKPGSLPVASVTDPLLNKLAHQAVLIQSLPMPPTWTNTRVS